MSYLITEDVRPEELNFLAEEKSGEKFYYIEGPFLRAEVVNGNRRRYPIDIMEREVERYRKNYINENRAYG